MKNELSAAYETATAYFISQKIYRQVHIGSYKKDSATFYVEDNMTGQRTYHEVRF